MTMAIKIHQKVPGIPKAGAACAPGVLDNGMPTVTMFLSAYDNYDITTVVASLRLSPERARVLAAQLTTAADEADRQASRPDGSDGQ